MFKPFIDDIGTLLTQPILNADAYKASHHLFEHTGFTSQYAYIEARKGGAYEEVMSFGWLYIIRYFMLQHITLDMIDEAEFECEAMGIPFNRKMWMHILRRYNGRLPITIKAIPEGTIVPQGCVLATIECTDPECAGLAAYVETLLLRVWFPITIATRSMRWWRMVNRYLVLSGDETMSEFKTIDFSARGCSSTETAGIGGMAHLVNHQVTDNMMGIRFAKHAYRATTQLAYTIPASEHSVTTSWGKEIKAPEGLTRDGEIEFYHSVLDRFGDRVNPQGGRYLVSIVIDTYDQDEAIKAWLDPKHSSGLRARLEASNMCLVLRPDSGDPVTNISHVLDLASSFTGHSLNAKGFKMLPDYVRAIQGDGIHEESLLRILQRLTWLKWSIDNLVFGSGGGLMVHDVERDTHRFAMKASEVVIEGSTRAIQKLVKTDTSKASKKGRFVVLVDHETLLPTTYNVGEVITTANGTVLTLSEQTAGNLLRTILDEGLLVDETTFEDVRERARLWRQRPSPKERHLEMAQKLGIDPAE